MPRRGPVGTAVQMAYGPPMVQKLDGVYGGNVGFMWQGPYQNHLAHMGPRQGPWCKNQMVLAHMGPR